MTASALGTPSVSGRGGWVKMRGTPTPRAAAAGGESACQFPRADAGEETDACGSSLFYDIVFHAIAVVNSMGNMKVRRTTAKLDCSFENHDGSGAIHVVIAVDKNRLFAFDGGFETVNCGFH